ncbi:MAG: hypothetical protein VSS75_002005 [Candidatus Parabeggiatoa sp.]|nr:hypothetical protein [Candidatus Parabeggiatoa sp.]
MKVLIIIAIAIVSQISVAKDLSCLLQQHKEWLKPSDTCPADVISMRNDDIDYIEGLCDSKIEECLKRCSSGNGESCYNLALTLQAEKYKKFVQYSEALFLKSCQLGSISGCTNRAAGMQIYIGKESLDCAVRTYEKSCELDDPWSCTMYGYHLATGKGITKNLKKSLNVFKKSCRYGKDDPACQRATEFSKQIKSALENR